VSIPGTSQGCSLASGSACGGRLRAALQAALLCAALTTGARAEESASAAEAPAAETPAAETPARASDEPTLVSPSRGSFSGLRRSSSAVAHTLGDRLDKGHDWLYRRLQNVIVRVDQRYADPKRTALLVPLSPLRIEFDAEILNRQHGLGFAPRPNIDATLRLPNIERRLRIFISSGNLSEAPGNQAVERNPVRAGLRFAPRSHIDFDIGVRLKFKPTLFAALRWAPQFDLGSAKLYPLVKPYVESGLGLGVSAGVTLEQWRGQWVARSSSYGNWLRNTSATGWAQTLLVGHAQSVIQERQYGRFTAGRDLACGTVAAVTASGDHLSSASLYEFSVTFKRPLHGGWLYGYVEPLVRWERGSDWHPDAGFRMGLDALFWGLAADSARHVTTCR
jgi:hypothetical protein